LGSHLEQREWMLARGDHAHSKALQAFQSHGVRGDRQRSHDTQAAATVEHGLYAPPSASTYRRRGVRGNFSLNSLADSAIASIGNSTSRPQKVRLQSAGNSFRARLEQIDVGDDTARIGKQLNTCGREFWVAFRTIEQNDTEFALPGC